MNQTCSDCNLEPLTTSQVRLVLASLRFHLQRGPASKQFQAEFADPIGILLCRFEDALPVQPKSGCPNPPNNF